MAQVVVGPVAVAACAILALGTLAYAVATAVHAWAGMRRRYPDRWSAALAAVALAALAGAIWAWGPQQLLAPLAPALAAVMVACAVAAPAFTAYGLQDKLDRIGQRMPTWLRWRLPDMSHEDRRKGPHLLMGLFVLDLAFVGHYLILAVATLGPSASAPQDSETWGNLHALASGPYLAAGQVTAVWFALVLVYVLLPVELLRLRFPSHAYPFKRIIEPRLRERERGLFGAHLYISVGVALALLALGRDPEAWDITVPAAIAMVSVTVFADAASALVGIRWGRTRWFHNAGKSYIGTFGGAVVALAFCLVLVGPVAALLAAILFVAVDAVAPRPIPISDNLLNPLGLAALFAAIHGHIRPIIPLP